MGIEQSAYAGNGKAIPVHIAHAVFSANATERRFAIGAQARREIGNRDYDEAN